jgi:hypothetical protein
MTDEGQNLGAIVEEAVKRVEGFSHKDVRQHENRKWGRGLTEEEKASRLANLAAAQGQRQPCIANALHEDGFFNDADPQYFIAKEKPEHRKILDMSLAGYTAKEIAAHVAVSAGHVCNVLRQPWARAYLIKQTKKTVQQEMREFLEAEVLPTLKVVVAVRDDEKARASDRLNASAQLLDRFLGKPVQPMTTETVDVKKLSSDELERQAAAIIGAGQTETTTA